MFERDSWIDVFWNGMIVSLQNLGQFLPNMTYMQGCSNTLKWRWRRVSRSFLPIGWPYSNWVEGGGGRLRPPFRWVSTSFLDIATALIWNLTLLKIVNLQKMLCKDRFFNEIFQNQMLKVKLGIFSKPCHFLWTCSIFG